MGEDKSCWLCKAKKSFLVLRIRSYADISSEKSVPRFTSLSTACPFLSMENSPYGYLLRQYLSDTFGMVYQKQ